MAIRRTPFDATRLATAAVLAAIVVASGGGCSSDESRAAYHNARAQAFLEEGNLAAADIEFRAVLSVAPDNVEANLALADMAETSGRADHARFYLREILNVDPYHSEVAVRLATLLRDDWPLEARQLLLRTIQHNERDAAAHIGLSQLEVWSGRHDEALTRAQTAIDIDASLPGGYWQLGIVYQAMMKHALEAGEAIDEAVRAAGVAAFEDFVVAGGQPEWKARLEQAEILSAGSHNRVQALEAARRALEVARLADGDGPKLAAAAHLARASRSQRDRGAYAEAIETVLEVHPRDFRSWRNLAELRAASGGSAEEVYERLLLLFPDDPEAHILYSKHIGATKGVRAALRYFDEQIAAGVDPPQLLSALRSYQVAYRLWNHAGRTLERMQLEYLGNPWTRLEEAKKSAEDGLSLAAIATLEEVVAEEEIVEALDMLAKLERFHGRPKRALRNIERAVELEPYYDPLLHQTLAEVRFEAGDFGGFIEAVDKIAQHDELSPQQELDRARALYAVGERGEGREALLALASGGEVSADATVDFIRYEGNNPKEMGRARRLLLAAIAREPDNRELVTARIELNLRSNRSDKALEILETLDIAGYPSNIRYLRARLRADVGNMQGAIADIDLTLRADPTLQGVADFALLVYARDADPEQHLKKLWRWIHAMRARPQGDWLTNSRRIAALQLLRSRLMHFTDRNDEAILILENAIGHYEYTGESRIDLAYLLTLSGRDPERAITIASEVVAKREDHPRALDALGFAYLTTEQPVDALENIRHAIRISRTPNALFHYHESLALRELGREPEALKAIQKVLGMDPNYPEAAELRRALESSIASPDDS
ncbi:MAG: tetratricopeptide repeat protein [Myxococcota bacterium]|nr:tetratricopeptide repeat protein [Myxococcota bacterium]